MQKRARAILKCREGRLPTHVDTGATPLLFLFTRNSVLSFAFVVTELASF
jgi:hypothetical protein